jgi:Abnormal spindle-like microcephaly-assoc'd, ASPM-SPD-2-Hydin
MFFRTLVSVITLSGQWRRMSRKIRIPRKWLGAAIALIAAAASVSCGGGNVKTASSAANSPASLALTASSLDFGNIAVGSSASKSITLTNSSASDGPSVTVSAVSATGSGFSVSSPGLPAGLGPGQSLTITVAFNPKSAGASNGTLSIAIAGQADPATVALTGTGLANGQLAVSPTALSFGSVTLGGSKNLSGTLTAGGSSVTISSASWSGSGFALSGISFPVTLAAGQSASFTVTFTPQAASSASGSVSFLSNASNSPATETFSGTGSQPAPTTQHSVSLSWDASASTVSGYYVYRGSQSGGPYTRVSSTLIVTTSYTDSTVQAGQTYYYVVTSVDASGTESSYSAEVSATIPSP